MGEARLCGYNQKNYSLKDLAETILIGRLSQKLVFFQLMLKGKLLRQFFIIHYRCKI